VQRQPDQPDIRRDVDHVDDVDDDADDGDVAHAGKHDSIVRREPD
jgi:hypothetical protein